jgi:PAS domain S-box-containing protein
VTEPPHEPQAGKDATDHAGAEVARLETALGQTQERYRDATAAADVGTWRIDLRTGEDLWDASLSRIAGFEPAEAVRRASDAYEIIHRDDRERARAAWDRFMASGGTYDIDLRIVRPDGEVRWVRDRGRLVAGPDGQPAYATGAVVDITDRKRAEQSIRELNERLERQVEDRATQLAASRARLRAFFDNLPDWLTLQRATGDGRFVYEDLNPACEKAYGMTREQVIGRTVEEVLGKEPAQLPLHHFRECLRTGEPQRYLAKRMMGGVTYTIDVMFALVPGEVDGDRFIITAARDVTDREQLQEQLRQAQKMEVVGQLTGGVAHDFNNLLTAVLGNLELAERRTEDATLKRLIRNAARAAERGARLNEQLLAFSRKQHLTPSSVDLNGSIAGMSDMLARTIGVTIEIRTILSPELWPALVDANQIELVILNLAINARDAMPVGGTLALETRNMAAAKVDAVLGLAPGDYVCVSVTDTGTGMPTEVLERAFEPFFTTKEAGKGSGLGLSQVYGVARQSGGTVRIRSAPGAGTTVELYLPRALGAPLGRAAESAAGAPAAAGRALVLVVDDQPDVREVTVDHLQALGYRTLDAPNGRIALALLGESREIGALVIDYAMPGQSGIEVMRLAREIRPELPMILLTGYADTRAVEAEIDARFVLKKPYRMRELAARLEFALSGAARHKAPDSNVVPLKPSRS